MNPASDSTAPLIRNGTREQYEALVASEREQLQARQREALNVAAAAVEAVEVRLNQGLAQTQLRSESGIRAHDLQMLLARKPPANNWQAWTFEVQAAAVATLSAWLSETQGATVNADDYAPTPSLTAIYDLCIEAHSRKRLIVVVGGYGVGKTCAALAAIEAEPRRHGTPGLVRIEVSESAHTINQLLCSIYFAIVNREPFPIGDEAVRAKLCEELRPGDVLILDECQRLATCANGRGVEAIRELYDRSGASIVMLGNEALTRRGNLLDAKLYGALASRARIFLTEFLHTSEADIDAFMAWREVAGVALRSRLVKAFAKTPNKLPGRHGGLRVVADLFTEAAEANDGELTAAAIMACMDARGC